MKRTKIVCTIGPASEKQATLERMIRAGMNVARLNMSHGDYGWHGRAIRTIREAAKRVGEPVAILLDLQGPKVRLGQVSGDRVQVSVGQRVVFTTSPSVILRSNATKNPVRNRMGSFAESTPTGASGLRMTDRKIPIAVPNFHKYAKKGAHLLIADGTIECTVERVAGRDIFTRVIVGGVLTSHKGIALKGVSLPLPALTVKDKKDIVWARRQDIDFVALSFVKRALDIGALRRLLRGVDTKIIVKIETSEAVRSFDEILSVTDGVIIARGDLGLALDPEDVPIVQKEIIEKCRRAAKPVIVATEMLASLEYRFRPTRAEVSDVANAVIDHTDATMLSGETATGRFPVEAVSAMARIIERTERSRFDDLSIGASDSAQNGEDAVAMMASTFARLNEADAIVAGSLTGATGRLLSRYRTEVPLFVGSPATRVVYELNLSWGVRPFVMPRAVTGDALLKGLLVNARKRGLKKGDKVVFVGSEHIGPHGQSFVGIRRL